jgi:hypothetical protein
LISSTPYIVPFLIVELGANNHFSASFFPFTRIHSRGTTYGGDHIPRSTRPGLGFNVITIILVFGLVFVVSLIRDALGWASFNPPSPFNRRSLSLNDLSFFLE